MKYSQGTCLTLWTSLWTGMLLCVGWAAACSRCSPRLLGVTISVSASSAGDLRISSSSSSSPFLSSYSAELSFTLPSRLSVGNSPDKPNYR